MNYYEHHLADYTQATVHLSMLEDAAYSRMLRWYYANERALPADIGQIERLIRAQSRAEREAVRCVLAEFFTEKDDGYHQDRADREIARYNEKQRKASASANARWGNANATYEAMRSHNKTDANATSDAMRSHNKTDANALRTHSVGNAHQTPDTRHHTPYTSQNTEDTLNSSPPSRAGAVCVAIRSEGIGSVNPNHPKLLSLIESGAGVDRFVNAARLALEKHKGFAYLLGIVQGQLDEEKQIADSPDFTRKNPPTGSETFRERDDRLARERMMEVCPSIAAKPPRSRNVIDITPASQSVALGVTA